MTGKSIAQCCALAAALALLAHAPARAKLSDPWLPIDPADLAMKSEPLAPGAPAIYLYREIYQDDTMGYADYYYRIKILTDDGKSWGTVDLTELTLGHVSQSIAFVSGRTIHPDGTIIPWQGQVIEQPVVRAHGVKEMAKTFSLPDVQTGSIIEYKFRVGWDKDWLIGTPIFATEHLFTRQLHCSLKPYTQAYILTWQTQNMPGGHVPVWVDDATHENGMYHFDAQNLPAIQDEDFMPPEESVRGSVIFYYAEGGVKDPVKFWKGAGKSWNDDVDHFIGRASAVRDEADKVAPSSDPPETRLRKLYARAQQVRNLSYAPEKSAKEVKAESLKDNKSAEDVLKNGYGKNYDINRFFAALARAAGFDATMVKIANRDLFFFDARILEKDQLEYGSVVLVKLNGQDVYLDPASPHAGFGQLPWEATGVTGLALDGKGGTFVTTTAPKSSDAVVERTATFKLGDDGWLQGKLIVTFSGQEAIDLRQAADNQDPADREKSLTDRVISYLPAGAAVKLTNQPDWAGSDDGLRGEFDVRVRPAGGSTGHLVLLSENFFANSYPLFSHPLRSYPIYFDHPWEFHDDVTLTLPLNLDADDIPAPVDRSSPSYGVYQLSCTKQPGALHFQRVVALSGIYYPVQFYGPLRTFFDEARNADQQQIMLHVSGTHGTPTHD
jgi:hypothetical protein